MKKNSLVVKHNSLIRSRYDYTLAELRMIIAVASMIEPRDEDFRTYSVPAKEYAELMGADQDNQYRSLKKLGTMLLSKPLIIPDSKGFLICNWFSSYRYIDGEGRIEVSFDPALKPHMLQLKEQFTKYKLENILRFKSVYSIRLYELAKSWEARGDFTISLDEFRQIMGLDCLDKKDKGCKPKYKLYGDLKRKVINRSIKEINALSDIKLSYKEKKLGRKVTDLVFTIKQKEAENWMINRKAFIAHIRKAYKPDPDRNHYPAIVTGTKYGDLKVDLNGKIYFTKPDSGLFDMDFSQADTIWSWLYNGVKADDITLEKIKGAQS